MRPRIVFRVDASRDIGTGHVMRCLALASGLRTRANVEFVCRELDGNLCRIIEGANFPVHRLPPATPAGLSRTLAHSSWLVASQAVDAEQTRDVVGVGPMPDWMIVDHYGIDAEWERALRPLTRRMMVVDDLADRPHDCDVLLDHNLRETDSAVEAYTVHVSKATRLLLGPRYALLRKEFASLNANARSRTVLRRVLVFFGGIDAGNFTARALAALGSPAFSTLDVDVVVGAKNPHRDALSRWVSPRRNFVLHTDTPRLGELMLAADLGVGAGGVSLLERICVGLPAIVVPVASNQKSGSKAAEKAGVALQLNSSFTSQDLAEAVSGFMAHPERLTEMSLATRGLVDGRGAERVARLLLRGQVTLRQARLEDRDYILAWRNHEAVRNMTPDPRPISADTHNRWFAATLASPDRRLLIAEAVGQPMGVLRYDFEGDQAIVSIYLAPEWLGRGYGPDLLHAGHVWLGSEAPQIRYVIADVLPHNYASVQTFIHAGYKPWLSRYRWECIK